MFALMINIDTTELEYLFDELFPITRSISGNGLRESLKIISSRMPMEIIEYPTGTECFDWTIPMEWNISSACIKKTNGETVIDFFENNLHILGYSTPFKGRISLKELQNHLYYIEGKPNAIPFVTSYYEPRWGFCLSYNQYLDLKDEEYDVIIDSTLTKGSITAGECFIKGRSDMEIILFSHIGHPSMANDQLSGPLTLTAVSKWLLSNSADLKYSYRIILAPETIGSIAYIHDNIRELKKNCIGGYTVVCTGDNSPFTFRMSREKDAVSDNAMKNALTHSKTDFTISDFSPLGCDERHFNSHGIGVPIGSIMRSSPGSYPEYHTSLDNKEFISFTNIVESAELLISAIRNIEADACVTAIHKNCEPKLDKYGLYPTISDKNKKSELTQHLISLWAYADGSKLSDIAQTMNVPIFELRHYADMLASHKIIQINEL